MMQSDPFAELLEQSDSLGPFSPCAHYDRDGDCIEFFLSNEPFYAIRVDHCITVYYSEKTSEVVGSQIKGIGPLLKKNPGFDIEIEDGRVQVSLILRASAWSTGDPVKRQSYKRIIRAAVDSDLKIDLACSV